jgi:bacterioferritin
MFQQQVMRENAFLQDVNALRYGVQAHLSHPVPHSSIPLLQSVLSAEIVCVLRYTMISVSEDGLKNSWIGTEFQAQADDERRHMKMAAERIEQLGGVPDFNPTNLASRAAGIASYGGNFAKLIDENLAAEQSVIAHYRDLIAHFGTHDPESRAMLEDIIRDEEDHTSDMTDLLGSYTG